MIDYKKHLNSLMRYFAVEGYMRKPYPKIVLEHKKQDGVFINTGYYNPSNKEIHLFVEGRHPKDVLRSCAHEIIHHNQNMEGRLKTGDYNGELITEDKKLKKLEAEAFLKGNLLFREWTETEKKRLNR